MVSNRRYVMFFLLRWGSFNAETDRSFGMDSDREKRLILTIVFSVKNVFLKCSDVENKGVGIRYTPKIIAILDKGC